MITNDWVSIPQFLHRGATNRETRLRTNGDRRVAVSSKEYRDYRDSFQPGSVIVSTSGFNLFHLLACRLIQSDDLRLHARDVGSCLIKLNHPLSL